jgi:hypothetical protein
MRETLQFWLLLGACVISLPFNFNASFGGLIGAMQSL